MIHDKHEKKIIHLFRRSDNYTKTVGVFFCDEKELYYMIAGYINTLQALWITK
jgi:hypothetical protein